MSSRLDELLAVARKPERRIVGLMSGTSLDGIDAALCRVSGCGTATEVVLERFRTLPFSPQLRDRIEAALEGDAHTLCTVNFELGEAFAQAARDVVEEAGHGLDEVDVIASHGQTVHHVDRAKSATPSTLQIGEPAVIAERTGRLVVADFRPRDIAAGGAGAPLVAYADHCLFSRPGRTRLLQNIGGIANVTVVTERPEDVVAFDTGPGNLVIDEVCREVLQDEDAFDRDGAYSRLGEVDAPLLARLLDDGYFRRPPPKTTGREEFGADYTRELIDTYDPTRLIDLLATVVQFTASSIVQAYRDFVFPRFPVDEVVVSGGGVHNQTLMDALRRELEADGVALRHFDELEVGFSADAKEAVAFAILANETIQGRTSNLPAATGARRPVVLGKVVL
ncbi:MAG: anhydro-N-acetylmuramic acid kinase [Planctomycetota bacterium]|nr:MAG: anhydro-N-acetylmuramic acid kinase [Planctomycetota bacterium]